MDNTNRKCIFGNDLLQGTQSNVGFPAAVTVGISQGFVKSLCSFLSCQVLSRRNVFPQMSHSIY